MTETFLLASAANSSIKVYHLSEDGVPKCGARGSEDHPFRELEPEHPAIQSRRLCKDCDGSADRAGKREQRSSLRDMIANGEVSVDV